MRPLTTLLLVCLHSVAGLTVNHIEMLLEGWELPGATVQNCPLSQRMAKELLLLNRQRTISVSADGTIKLKSHSSPLIVCVNESMTATTSNSQLGVRFPAFFIVPNADVTVDLAHLIRPRLNQEVYFLELESLSLVEVYSIKEEVMTTRHLGTLGDTADKFRIPNILHRRSNLRGIDLTMVVAAQEPNIMYLSEEKAGAS